MKQIFNKFKYIGVILICLGLIVPVHAIEIPQNSSASIIRPHTFGFGTASDVDEGVSKLIETGNFKHLTFTDFTGYSIKYWAHIPTDANGKYIENLPLVMYMHGYSDGGDNNIAIRYHNAVVFKLIQQQNIPERQAIILVPQTPNSENGVGESDYFKDQWVGIRGNNKWSQWNRSEWSMDEVSRTKNLNAVVELVKTTQRETKSDVDRAYVTGISMGGYATWDLISRNNENLFAAAVPICGVGDPSKVDNIKNLPIRIYHGSLDSTINRVSSQKMYTALRKYGNVSYTEYEKEGHASWNAAYSPSLDDNKNGKSNLDDLIDWMFNQSRNGTLDGKANKEPLNSIIWDAKQENKENYSSVKWEKLQTAIQQANTLVNMDCMDNEVKDMIKTLDTIIMDENKDKADMSELLKEIEAGEKLKEQDYSASSWLEFQKVLMSAREIAKNLDALQKDIDAVLAKLEIAIDNLVPINNEQINKTALGIAIEMAESANLENIVPAVVEEFNAALANAKEVYANVSASQSEVNAAFDRLANVMHMLEFFKGDKELLQKLVDQINDLVEEQYISSTWQAMMPALQSAKGVLDNVNAMQGEVDEVYDGLIRAFLNLRLKPSKDLLADLIDKVNGLNSASYTANTWALVANEVLNDKEVLENPEVSEDKAKVAGTALTNAIKGLAANSVETIKTGDTTSFVVITSLGASLTALVCLFVFRKKKLN